MLDGDLIDEALQSAATTGRKFSGGYVGTRRATAARRDVARLRRQIAMFLEDLPADISLGELREAVGERSDLPGEE